MGLRGRIRAGVQTHAQRPCWGSTTGLGSGEGPPLTTRLRKQDSEMQQPRGALSGRCQRVRKGSLAARGEGADVG